MNLKRLLPCLCALAIAACTTNQIKEFVDDAKVKTRIGVLANTDIGPGVGTNLLGKAFAFFKQAGVDAVVVTGDLTLDNAAEHRELFDETCRRALEGTDVKLILDDGRQTVNGFDFAVSTARPRKACDVLTFYGARRMALTDELCFHPRDGKAICAGSMHGVEVPDAIRDEELRKRTKNAAQGLLVSVYSDQVVIRRLDFTQKLPLDRDEAWEIRKTRKVYAEDVAEPWTLALDGTTPAPGEDVPQFWPDTRIQALRGYLKGEEICTVKWPTLLKRNAGTRARWYEVAMAFADDPRHVIQSRTVLSGGFFLSESRDLGGAQTVYRMSELPKADDRHQAVVFSVTPVGAYGKHGKPFTSPPVPLRK